MGEKIKRIESIRSELAKKPNESVKKEKVEQKIGVDEVMKRLKNILEKKGAFDSLNELKNLPPALKEERKLLRIKEGLKDRREDDKISRQHFKTKRRSN